MFFGGFIEGNLFDFYTRRSLAGRNECLYTVVIVYCVLTVAEKKKGKKKHTKPNNLQVHASSVSDNITRTNILRRTAPHRSSGRRDFFLIGYFISDGLDRRQYDIVAR